LRDKLSNKTQHSLIAQLKREKEETESKHKYEIKKLKKKLVKAEDEKNEALVQKKIACSISMKTQEVVKLKD